MRFFLSFRPARSFEVHLKKARKEEALLNGFMTPLSFFFWERESQGFVVLGSGGKRPSRLLPLEAAGRAKRLACPVSHFCRAISEAVAHFW